MSSPERERQKRREWEEEQRRAETERVRRASITMWERIEEFVQDDELKIILHALARKCGLEEE